MHRWKLVYYMVCSMLAVRESSFETRSSQSHLGRQITQQQKNIKKHCTFSFNVDSKWSDGFLYLSSCGILWCCCYWNRKVCIYCIWKKTLILMDFLCFRYKETEVILVVFIFHYSFDCQFLLWNCRSIHWKWFKTNNKWLTDYIKYLQSFRGSIMCDFTRDHYTFQWNILYKFSFILFVCFCIWLATAVLCDYKELIYMFVYSYGILQFQFFYFNDHLQIQPTTLPIHLKSNIIYTRVENVYELNKSF